MSNTSINVRCEGSGAWSPYCPMCGQVFASVIVPEHERDDILAMLERGDFDE